MAVVLPLPAEPVRSPKPFDSCILQLVEEPDGRKGIIRFHNKDFLHVRGITQLDALFRKAEIHFVFYLVDNNDTIGRDTAFDFQKEVLIELFLWKPSYLLRL